MGRDMKPNDKRFSVCHLLVGTIVFWGVVDGAVEMCSPGRVNTIYRITKDECPFGVLFKLPVDSGCFQTSDADV